ncbi:MAG TPA: FlgD immunoglobulin-like domain containing protein, partial [Methanosarcinales archaeon]|nr:FlgD immunoglobulin-like domain containing protein [Methanosarcinales archaeon]
YNPNHGYYISGGTSGNTPIDDKPKDWPHDDNLTQNFVVYYKKTNQMIVPKSDLVPNIDHQYASYDYNKVFIDQAKPSSSIVLDDLKSMLALGFSIPFIVIDPLMEVVFSCPVEPLIRDENGKRIGIVNGSQVNEIPGAVINMTNDLKVFYLPVGLNYKIEITGTGSGTMYASFFIPKGQDKVSQMIYKNVPITSTSKIYSSLNQSTTLHTMSIDTNGDGIIEQVIHPDVTSNRQQPLDMGDSLVSKIHNYPNPMKSAGTTFTYYLSKDAKVSLKIYDVSNDLVAQFDNLPGNANIWNEYPWNGCDKEGKQLSNGVYIYVVTADSGDNKESKINKLLILR